MRIRRAPLVITALAAVLAASQPAAAPGSSGGTTPAGQIVFASDRATANPGEIYALAPGSAPRDISRSPYADTGLAVSPVGKAFAFWSDRTGPWRLSVAPDGGALRTVVIGGAAGADPQYPSASPLFSRDGTRLLIPYVTANSADYVLRFALANVRSGPATPVALSCLQPPSWSPDSLLVACVGPKPQQVSVFDLAGHVRFKAPGTAMFWSADGRLAVAGPKRTLVMSAGGAVLARLDGVAQAWSPDGRLLALAKPGSLLLAQPGRSAAIRVLAHGADDVYYGASFTPDGRDLAYSGSHSDETIVPVAGGASRPLGTGFGGTWSRSGRYAFADATGTTVTIRVGDRLGFGARVAGRFPFDDHGNFALAWLGDGSRLLYEGSSRDHADLWAMTADGAAQHRLTHDGQAISSPAWSADGTQLAYAAAGFTGGLCGYCGGSVALAGVQGRPLSLVPGTPAGEESADGTPAWAPSGKQLAVTNDYNGGVYVVGVDGSGRAQVAPDAAASPAWSPDGTTIAYVDDFSGGRIWGVDPAGANLRRLLPQSKLKAFAVAWSPIGGQLAFDTATGVYVAAADGSGVPRLVASASITPAHVRLSFSPDGSQIAYAALAGAAPHRYTAIYVAGVDGSGLRQLTKGPFDSFDPAWRPQPATP